MFNVRRLISAHLRKIEKTKKFSTMRAAIQREVKGRMQIETLSIPKPGPGEVLVKNVAAGVCHSDLSVMEGLLSFPRPAVFGHEMSGEVAEINGCETTDLKIGDRVIGTFVMPCGSCHFCSNQQEDICESFF